MPKVFTDGPFDFFFYSNEGHEPVHVHVRKGSAGSPDACAKYWLGPLEHAYSEGFTPRERARIVAILRREESRIVAAWHSHFG
jgi:hypothetical protein